MSLTAPRRRPVHIPSLASDLADALVAGDIGAYDFDADGFVWIRYQGCWHRLTEFEVEEFIAKVNS